MTPENSYKLDKDDIIVSVGDAWNDFAAENNSPSAFSSNVVGRNLWQFIAGVQTRSYLNAIFFACRMDTQPFSISYRCDAPDEKRLFRLSISPGEKGSLILNHSLVHTKLSLADQNVPVFAEHYDNTRCSICCSFLIGENWIDTFAYPDARFFAKSYGICPNCRAEVREALDWRKRQDGSVVPLPFVGKAAQ